MGQVGLIRPRGLGEEKGETSVWKGKRKKRNADVLTSVRVSSDQARRVLARAVIQPLEAWIDRERARRQVTNDA